MIAKRPKKAKKIPKKKLKNGHKKPNDSEHKFSPPPNHLK